MALESEPQSTPLGGSNLDALKSESTNNDVDLEDGEIDDDDDDNAVLAVSSAPAQTPAPSQTPALTPPVSGPSTPREPPVPKGHDGDRRERRDGDRRERHESSLSPWLQKRLGPTPPKLRKGNKGSWGRNNFMPDEDENDFAVQLEKALQAKAREKAQQASKDKSGEEGDEREEHHSDDDEDDHHRRKRKRKKSRDEEGEGDRERDRDRDRHRESKKKRRDLDENMIFARGASPHHHHHPPGSPPHREYDPDRSYDSYGDDEEDHHDEGAERPGEFSSRGRGRGGKGMRGSGRGRGRGGGPSEIGRGGFMNKRGSKRANSRGGLMGKSQQRPGREHLKDQICMYFMQGKCPKDADDCPFSHDAQPRRKMELCKFYNMNCCAKREKCLYMHKDFPCKDYHTGRRCNSGDKCRYSHELLNDVTRGVLLKHIELAPKEILGQFRRLTREQAILIIDKAAKMRAEGKNPEGVDLLRMCGEEGYESDHDRAHTPMPSSPGDLEENELEIKRNRGEESRRRDYHDSIHKRQHHDGNHDRHHGGNHERERNRDRNQSDKRDDKKERRERRRKRRWDTPDSSPSRLMKLQETLQKQLREQDNEETNTNVKQATPRHSFEGSDLVIDEGKDEEMSESKSSTLSKELPSNSLDLEKDDGSPSEKYGRGDVSEDSGEDSQDTSGVIPSHLPKRQRELFLRIQQQQREAEHNKGNKAEESDDDAGAAAEDDWYSSDEDGPHSLTDVLKNLKEGQKGPNSNVLNQKSIEDGVKDKVESHESPKVDQLPARRPPLLPTPTILTDLMKNTAIDQLLSTIRYGPTGAVLPNSASVAPISTQAETTSVPTGLQSPSSASSLPLASTAPVRDPRLSRDPRSRGSSLVTSLSPQSSPSSNSTEPPPRVDPRREPRPDPRQAAEQGRRDPRTDPRLDSTGNMSVEALASPRSDQRSDSRLSDPRAARADTRRSSDGSSSSSLLPKSIYDMPHPPILSGSGDVDLRIRNVTPDGSGDTDFRRHNSQFGVGDMDLRRDLHNSGLSPSLFPAQDTDLRFRLGLTPQEQEEDYAVASQGDLDLRRMALPFKPAPVHTPATEIAASLSTWNPPPYRVVRVDIPKPDFTHLKINPRDPQVKLDPRLRRIYGLSQADSAPSATSVTSDTPLSPTSETFVQTNVNPAPVVARTDPRRRGSSSMSRPADPRQSRIGAGTSSACPPTPRNDEFDEPTLGDTDLRMQTQFGRQQVPWDIMNSRGRGLLPHPDPNFIPNAAFGRMSQGQSHAYQQQQSYTPPPT